MITKMRCPVDLCFKFYFVCFIMCLQHVANMSCKTKVQFYHKALVLWDKYIYNLPCLVMAAAVWRRCRCSVKPFVFSGQNVFVAVLWEVSHVFQIQVICCSVLSRGAGCPMLSHAHVKWLFCKPCEYQWIPWPESPDTNHKVQLRLTEMLLVCINPSTGQIKTTKY